VDLVVDITQKINIVWAKIKT